MARMPSPNCSQRPLWRAATGTSIATAVTMTNLYVCVERKRLPTNQTAASRFARPPLRHGAAHRPGGCGHRARTVGGTAAIGIEDGILDLRLAVGRELGEVATDRTLAAQ